MQLKQTESADTRIEVVDSAKVATKKCPLCQKEIELDKFRIHEVMCARMNYVCKKCGKVVLKAERETHDEEECGRPEEVEEKVAKANADVSAIGSTSQTTGSSNNGANDAAGRTTERKVEEEKMDAEPSSFAYLGAEENQDEATEREIQRLLQEDMNQYDAQHFQDDQNNFDSNMPMSNYEKSKQKTAQLREMYGDVPELWPEGVRPADESKEQQLIGGDDDYHPGFNFTGMAQNFTQSLGFGGANRTDDALPVNDNNGIMMPNNQGLNRSNSQTGLPEISNQHQSYSSTQIYANGQVYHSYNEYANAQGHNNPQPSADQFGPVPEGSSLGATHQQYNQNSNVDVDQEMRQIQEQSEMEALEAQLLKEIMEQSMKDAEQQQ